MADEVDFPRVPPSDDRILLAWSKVRSRLHESEHRFNSRYAERYYAGGNADPQEVLDYFVTMYEPAVAMAVKTVTDHESAVACGTELDLLLKKILNICSLLLREVLPKESPEKVKALCSELRRRLLPRSEHWKAEAHRLARKIPQTGGASPSNQQTARGAALAPSASEVELRPPPAIGPMEPTESTGAESACRWRSGSNHFWEPFGDAPHGPPFPLWRSSQNGPRRQEFASPRPTTARP